MRALRSALVLCCVCELSACGSTGDHGSGPSGADGRLRPAVDYNFCPIFDYYLLVPRDIEPGVAAEAAVWVSDRDDEPANLSYAWRATSGIFSEPWLRKTTYSCAAPGEQTLTVDVRDPRGCKNSLPLGVNCVAP